jgi:methionyl-tRNA formyltransferase
MGTPEFAASVLERLCRTDYEIVACVTQPDKPTGRHMTLKPTPAKVFAESRNIPVYQPASLRTAEFYDLAVSLKPDLIVTAAYGKILPQNILSIPTRGCINVHASLLPKYRGAAPVQWSIIHGDAVTGVTIMNMDAGMDTGNILAQREVPIGLNVHTHELMDTLAQTGAELLAETLPLYLDGRIVPVIQDDSLAVMSPPIRKEQGQIDWHKSAFEIHNLIRALSTWPGAYTFLGGSRLKIYRSSLPENTDALIDAYRVKCGEPVPGSVLSTAKSGITVACGSGVLVLLCVQPESGRRMEVCDCAHNYRIGEQFDGAAT